MQLDRTEIVIRARGAAELCDLSLQVLKRHVWAIAASSGLLGWPLLLLDSWAIAWMLGEEARLALDHLDTPESLMRWRHATHLIALYVMQFPLVSLPTSVYLGHQIFFQPLPLRSLLGRLLPIAGRCLLILGIIRLGLVGLVMQWWVDRQVAFDVLVEFWLIFALAGVAVVQRIFRPFAPEILGLELCRLRSRRAGEISYYTRSSSLHRYLFSEQISRFAGISFYLVLLTASLLAAQLFVIGASTGYWQWNWWLDYIGLPLSLWCVGLFAAVFRFLSYLDSRIRLEGWEVELRLKAEALRLAPAPQVARQRGHSGLSSDTAAELDVLVPELVADGRRGAP